VHHLVAEEAAADLASAPDFAGGETTFAGTGSDAEGREG